MGESVFAFQQYPKYWNHGVDFCRDYQIVLVVYQEYFQVTGSADGSG